MTGTPSPPDDRWTDAFLDSMRLIADPQVDPIVRTYFDSFPTEEQGHRALAALRSGYLNRWDMPMPADLPAVFRTFFDTPVQYPGWVDPRRIDIASGLFLSYGPITTMVLMLKSWSLFLLNPAGAHLFWAANIFSKTSVSHQLRQLPSFILNFTAKGQLAQTLTTWPPYNNAPGLPPGVSIYKSGGVVTVQKLRVLHSVNRIFYTLKQPDPENDWDWKRFGAPINQEDLAMAMLHFVYSTISGLADLGIAMSPIEQDSMFMAWKTVLFLFGLKEELQPRDFADGRALLDAMCRRHHEVTPQAIKLLRSELDVVRHLLPFGFRRAVAALMRYLIGKPISDELKIPNPRLLLWLMRSTAWLWKGNKLLLFFIYWLSPKIIRALEAENRVSV